MDIEFRMDIIHKVFGVFLFLFGVFISAIPFFFFIFTFFIRLSHPYYFSIFIEISQISIILFGILTSVMAIFFLKRKPFSRLYFEILGWLILILLIIFCVVGFIDIVTLGPNTLFDRIFFSSILFLVTFTFAFFDSILLYFLRHNEFKKLFKNSGEKNYAPSD